MRRKSMVDAERVGTTELRGNLAKYLKKAKAGSPIIVQERGVDTYVLQAYQPEAAPSVFGGLRERTRYHADAVPNATEAWTSGELP